MKYRLCSVYDAKAKAFIAPFVMHRPEMAVRAFTACVNDESHMFHKHAEDYTLFELGEFNDETGMVSQEAQPELLCSALSVKEELQA